MTIPEGNSAIGDGVLVPAGYDIWFVYRAKLGRLDQYLRDSESDQSMLPK